MNKSFFLITLFISIAFSQNINSHIWSGVSVSTSDNLDALNLNPAGLGVSRGNQFAVVVKQIPNHTDKYYFGITTRYTSGFSTEIYRDEESIKYAFGFGTSLYKNLYAGFKYHKNTDYSYGILYRPINLLSLGATLFTNKYNDYKELRYGFALRPFSLNRFSNKNNSSFGLPTNWTFGYDKISSQLDNSYQEQYFVSLTITPGIDVSYFTFENLNGDTYGLNISFNIGKEGVQINNYPSNPYFNLNSSSNSYSYYNYSQKSNTKLDFTNKKGSTFINMKLDGYFIEEKPKTSPFDFLFEFNPLPFSSQNIVGIQLKSWIDDVDKMSKDKDINGLIIHLGNVKAGMAKRKEMFDALMRFKNSGKQIIVYADKGISGSDYHLISMADEIYTHHMMGLDLKGFNLEVTYLKQLLDTLSIVPEVVRVSPYKTGPETLLNETMSNEFRENYGELLDDLYNSIIQDISLARGWSEERTIMTIDLGPYWNISDAIDKELITGTMFPDQFDEYIEEYNDKEILIVQWDQYDRSDPYNHNWKMQDKPKIAIIYATGGIISGKSNPGPTGSTLMGDQTIKKAIKEARENDNIDAIVLRVDSGGGSGLASDMIWREVYKTVVEDEKNIKPFIVSMSDAAASGGYYISCHADKIVASKTTLTGSIGVYWMRINFSQLLKRIGLHTDNIKKGEKADFGSSKHLLTDEERAEAFNNIMEMYQTFKQRVIDGRDNLDDINILDDIALGRVWTGDKAHMHGLVDVIGGLHDAIDIAKESAGISSDEDIDIIELPEIKDFSFMDLFKDDKEDVDIRKISMSDLFPDEMAKQLDVLNIIPVIMNDEIQFIMPYNININ